jgi:DNA-directed RNA polymerase subunit RPC12/RpoP/predicted kinase
MYNVCPACGQYSEEEIDPAGPHAVCPACGHRQRFRRLPLFVITGASGAGKTVVCLGLVEVLRECVVLESDILWRSEFDRPEEDYRTYRNLWLRLVKNIAQGRRPVVLCGSVVPDGFERCPERRYLSGIHYLALVCDDDELIRRLRARPVWRGSSDEAFIERMLNFNGWFRRNAAGSQPPVDLLDTTHITVDETVARVADWVRARWPALEG